MCSSDLHVALAEIILSTHDADGLSERDVQLAHIIDELAPERDRRPSTP